ncbi:MAG: pilus assembly FimT family protein, partial [Acidimicrobiales bacterium]
MKTRGFTIIELVVVLAVMAIAMAVALPRFRLTPSHKVRSAANQLVRDLELARTRALGTKRKVRVQFDIASGSYT